MSRLGGVSWRVDHTLCSSAAHALGSNSAQLTLQVLPPSVSGAEGGKDVSLHLTQDKLRMLLHELEAARDVMKGAD